MEHQVLEVLAYRLMVPTAYTFWNAFAHAMSLQAPIAALACYLIVRNPHSCCLFIHTLCRQCSPLCVLIFYVRLHLMQHKPVAVQSNIQTVLTMHAPA